MHDDKLGYNSGGWLAPAAPGHRSGGAKRAVSPKKIITSLLSAANHLR